MNDGALVVQHGGALTAVDMRQQVNLIQEVMREVMKPDVHYGVVPGTGDKPSLLKAGAEKLCMVFKFGPEYDIVDKEREGDHLTITSKCTLFHIPTGMKVGSALGSCSTMEAKYAYRKGVRKCPACNSEAIIKGKKEYGGGWVCFKSKGGCGAKFDDGDPAIEGQQVGRVANEDKADQYNTVLKMANKRALLAAVLNATAASDIFSQDLLDDTEGEPELTPAGRAAQEKAAGKKKPPAEPKPQQSAPVQMEGCITDAQKKILRRKMDDPSQEAALIQHFGVDKIEAIPAAKINEAITFVESL